MPSLSVGDRTCCLLTVPISVDGEGGRPVYRALVLPPPTIHELPVPSLAPTPPCPPHGQDDGRGHQHASQRGAGRHSHPARRGQQLLLGLHQAAGVGVRGGVARLVLHGLAEGQGHVVAVPGPGGRVDDDGVLGGGSWDVRGGHEGGSLDGREVGEVEGPGPDAVVDHAALVVGGQVGAVAGRAAGRPVVSLVLGNRHVQVVSVAGMGIGRGSADFRWKKNVRPPKNKTVRSN